MTATSAVRSDTVPKFRPTVFPPRPTLVEQRADGTILLRCATPPADPAQRGLGEFAAHWAVQRGDTCAFAERESTSPDATWRMITWAEMWQQIQAVGAALLEMGLGADRPLLILSGNSIEHAVLALAAEHVGVPMAPVSPAYSLVSKDFARLRDVVSLVPPGAIFAQDAAAFARALDVIGKPNVPVIAVHGARDGQHDWASLVATTVTPARRAAVQAAHDAIREDDLGRVLFTSGSTGVPKGVALSHGNLRAVAAYYLESYRPLLERPSRYLDWLPWHHGLGGVLNMTRVVTLGGSHYIDDGRPLPGQFERTVRNMRDVASTVFTAVPAAWTMLVTAAERDPEVARNLFSEAVNFSYGGASLPRDVWDRIHALSERTIGERVAFCSGLACTESSGVGLYCTWPSETTGNIGVPMPGVSAKLVPLEGGDGRYEIRIKGPSVFKGYVQRPDLTAAAFDEEGFFKMGDAVRLQDPSDPARGLSFAGRVAEDFKLTNGTWVRTGAVRLTLVERCAPLLNDAVICGHDHDYLAALAWPNVAACRSLAPELAALDAEALVRHPVVVEAIRARLQAPAGGNGASLSVRRVMLMAEPPSMDANEIADKGYVNQAATRARRAHLVEALFHPEPESHIACAR